MSAAVDVLLAVRNGEAYLSEALDTLLAQDMPDFRLIAVDDASEDGTEAILKAYAARDPRVEIVRREAARGLAAALNAGLARCTAPFVARADGDDRYAPNRLSAQLRRMRGDPDLGVLSCGYRRIDAAGRVLSVARPLTGPDRLRFQMTFGNCLLHPGVMFRRDTVRAAGGYDTAYWTAQDSELWARLSDKTRMDNLPEPLVDYRIHESSVMKTRGAAGQALSLSVPRRQLSAYLGRDVALAETRAAVALHGGFETLNPVDIARGLAVLREVDRRARQRESTEVVAYHRDKIRRGLYAQARRRAPNAARRTARLVRGLTAVAGGPTGSAGRAR